MTRCSFRAQIRTAYRLALDGLWGFSYRSQGTGIYKN